MNDMVSRDFLYINVNILFASSLIIREGDVTVVVLVRSVSRIDSSLSFTENEMKLSKQEMEFVICLSPLQRAMFMVTETDDYGHDI